jgi:cytochrome c oxidase subunit 2
LAAVAGSAESANAAGPEPWEIGFQPPVTPIAQQISGFNDLLLVIIVAIVVFVLALLLYAMWRFNERRNSRPTRTTHHTVLEVMWTTVPVIILVIIAIPSFKLLYYTDRVEDADMTIKAIGRQWYWSYEYPDNGNFTFDSNLIPEEDLKPEQPRLLATDNNIVLPVDTTVRLLVTASDVMHSFAMPPFGLKVDAIPGKINESWIYVPEEYAGEIFYGQCSELCGTGHAYMPIAIEMVSKERFEQWLAKAKKQFARIEEPIHVAQVPSEE